MACSWVLTVPPKALKVGKANSTKENVSGMCL